MSHRVAVEAICLLWLYLSLMKENRAEDVLIIIADYYGSLYIVNKTDDSTRLVYKEKGVIRDLSYDAAISSIYWSKRRQIRKIRVDGTNSTLVIDVNDCSGLVVDTANRFLFYTERRERKVKKFDLRKKTKDKVKKVIATLRANRMPFKITADCNKRMVYWTVQGPKPRIDMCDYNGGNKQSVKVKATLPGRILLDPTGTKLFWLDEYIGNNDVMLIDLNTTLQSRRRDFCSVPYDLSIMDEKVYFMDLFYREHYLIYPLKGGRRHKVKLPPDLSFYRYIRVIKYPYVCPNLTYGYACEETCGHCKNGDSCVETQGVCPNGCEPPWTGSHCDIGEEKYNLLIIGICSGVGALVIIGIAVGVVLFLKRRGAAAPEEEQIQLME